MTHRNETAPTAVACETMAVKMAKGISDVDVAGGAVPDYEATRGAKTRGVNPPPSKNPGLGPATARRHDDPGRPEHVPAPKED